MAGSEDGMHQSKTLVRSGIRTHAWRTRLRPERSALDRSAILTAGAAGTRSAETDNYCPPPLPPTLTKYNNIEF